MAKIQYIIIIYFGLFTYSTHSQWAIMRNDADSLVKLGSDYIYDIEFDKAEQCFQEVIQLYPKHPAGYFLSAMIDWWKVWLNRETQEYDKGFLEKIQKVIDVCDVLLDSNAYDINALFFKGGAIGYRGRYYAIRQSWYNAARDSKTGLEILQRCQKIAPSNHDIMLGTGIYNYFAVKFQEEYPLLKPLMVFLPQGDKVIGLLQLQAASRYARYAAIEAKVVLLQIYYQYENNYSKALDLGVELFAKYPQNPYFHRYLGRLYVVSGYMDKMESLWREALNRYIEKKPGYEIFTAREALYYIGYALMNKGDYEMSLQYFYKCDEASRRIDKEPSGFMVRLNIKIGNIYDLQGKRDLAINQYKKVLKMKEYQDSHKQVRVYINQPYGQ